MTVDDINNINATMTTTADSFHAVFPMTKLIFLPLFQMPGEKALQIKEQPEKQSQSKGGSFSTITFSSLRK